jgi:ADP-heptose:LPS heptosyltransferase
MKQFIVKAFDSLVGGIICYFIGLYLYDSKRVYTLPENPKRILVIRPGGIGDMLLLLPSLCALRNKYPEAQIDVLCEQRNVQALELAGLINVTPILYSTKPWVMAKALWLNKYDIAIDTEQFHKFSAIFAFASGAPIRIGFKIAPKRNPLYTHLVNYDLIGYEANEFFKLLQCLSVDVALKPAITNVIKFADGVEQDSKTLVIHPSASTEYKLWHRTRFVKLLLLIKEKYPDCEPIIVGSQSEREYAMSLKYELLAKDIKSTVVNGEYSLSDTAELISNADLFIGSDSGLAHLAVLLDTPSITLFGPSDAKKWGVQNDKHVCIFSKRTCAPCFIFGYQNPCKSKECMRDITVEEVFDSVQNLLD